MQNPEGYYILEDLQYVGGIPDGVEIKFFDSGRLIPSACLDFLNQAGYDASWYSGSTYSHISDAGTWDTK